ncbi:hypothetical protein BB561_004238 [Smittium simulii]|uniref:Mediator of RNA polymerase II transcription subunit 21 n=1 Tax=Smittium simulii TaxID=133385 RepID=A0A2T9YHF2_9FUNG|nr:hypothetical protein BB561_004238 [Smittium simulii]
MDKITQLQDHLEQLALLFVASLDTINRHADFKLLDTRYPITQKNELITESKNIQEIIQEQSDQIVEHTKQIDALIKTLPTIDSSENIQSSVNMLEKDYFTDDISKLFKDIANSYF